jgi:2-haloacid dehalogenase
MDGDRFGSVAFGPRRPRARAARTALQSRGLRLFRIFDANSVIPEVEKAFPGKGAEFTRLWRAKQFEYCYLRTITGRFADFSSVTEDALVYAAEATHLELTADTRQRLLNAYLNLKPWPDAADGLRKLKAAGVRIITISVFSGSMLRANAEHAGIADLFDELLSTEVNRPTSPIRAPMHLAWSGCI